MTAARTGVMNGAGYGVDLASLLGSQPCGDQRSTGWACLDDQHAEGKPADDSVATRKVRRLRRAIERKLGYQRPAAFDDPAGQVDMSRRVQPLQPRAQYRDGVPAGLQGALVRGAVDAQR